jgi:RNA polymerase sigma factor (sigma-70 family)
VADTFAEVAAHDARALRAFRGEARLGTFLAVIGARTAAQALRRRGADARARSALAERARRSGPPGVAAASIASAAGGASAPAEARERAAAVRAALDGLAPRDRLMLQLFHGDGRSYREVAQALGIAASGVGAELARARRRLAARLEGRGVLEEEGAS